jgi:uncharacterized protein YqeY
MTLEERLHDRLKTALKEKNQKLADVVRMLKTKVMERRTSKGFKGEVTDAVVEDVIATYQKQLRKAVEEYEKLGAAGVAHKDELTAEIAICQEFLPQSLDEATVQGLVKDAIAKAGASSRKQAGMVVGTIMKEHKGKVDAALVKRLVEGALDAIEQGH